MRRLGAGSRARLCNARCASAYGSARMPFANAGTCQCTVTWMSAPAAIFFKCLMAPVSGNSPPFSLSLLAVYSACMASRLSHINRNMNSCDSRFLQFWQFLDPEHPPLH